MNKKTKGQKFFLLTIISAICIGAFCFVGCSGRNSCFGCDLQYDEDYFASSCLGVKTSVTTDKGLEGYSGFIRSCNNCGTTNSCGAIVNAGAIDDYNFVRIRFLADSENTDNTKAIFSESSCSSEDNFTICNTSCGTYTDDDGSNLSSIYITNDDYGVSCGETEDNGYLYGAIKAMLIYLFG